MKPELERMLEKEFLDEEDLAEAEREAEETARIEADKRQSALEDYADGRTPILMVNPETLPVRNYDNIEELLSVKELVKYRDECFGLDEKIKEIGERKYQNESTDRFMEIGLLSGIGITAMFFVYPSVIDKLNKIVVEYQSIGWFLMSLSTLGIVLGGILGGRYIGEKLGNYISNNSKKKQDFYLTNMEDLAKANLRKLELKEKMASYKNNPAEGSIVLFKSPQTDYSLGYVQSTNPENLEVQQEYMFEDESVREHKKPIFKIKPDEFIYVLISDQDLSADDLMAMDGEAISCQIDGRTEFGFVKVKGGGVRLYTDMKRKYMSSRHSLNEVSAIRRLVPKKTSEGIGYRVKAP